LSRLGCLGVALKEGRTKRSLDAFVIGEDMHARSSFARDCGSGRSYAVARCRGPLKVLLSLGILVVFLTPDTVRAISLSFTDSLASPTSTFETTFNVVGTGDVTIQTFGFGGGTNAAGQTIPAGGFDSTVALFSGSGNSASIVMIGTNPAGSSDLTSLFSPGCPPAGMVTIGTGSGSIVCGDSQLVVPSSSLSIGTYILTLSVAGYQPLAFNPGPPTHTLLSDGFSAPIGTPMFQTCNVTSDQPTGICVTTTSNFAVDISGPIAPVPEPGMFILVASGLAMLTARSRRAPDRSI